MAMSEYRKMEIEQRKLNRDLDKIAKKRAKEIYNKQRTPSYCMHTPSEVLKKLSERSHSELNEENLGRKYIRIRKR